MKKTILAAAAICLTLAAQAQPDYKAVLKSTFDAFDTTFVDMVAKQNLGNKLVLIAKKYNDQWAPQFYAAYSIVQLAYFEKDPTKKDALLDEAANYRDDAAHLLGKENSETEVMTAMIANARIGVDPRNRWQKYGKEFEAHLEKAKELNADNPRIYLEYGITKFYTPKMFGGGKKEALPYFEKAKALYAKENQNDIEKPYWGLTTMEYFLEKAKGTDSEK
ncbi:MAG: hypothetical protein JST06_01265 [Bacteroidetes bacterium]|nr:hypothetical protein [Bacteroidota bacterium]MBS1629177.1 hypothetical protein [Bacteroidota bacterium]